MHTIGPALVEDLDLFFAYLDDHLSDNGVDGTALFMPLSREQTRLQADIQQAFRTGVGTPLGQPGWRRLWLAMTAEGGIAGHIDLRARREANTAHRALLGMGVHRDYRRQGIGSALVGAVIAWAEVDTTIDWIDLEVMSANRSARHLYARLGFIQMGEVVDMFRIDGESHGYTSMSRKIR